VSRAIGAKRAAAAHRQALFLSESPSVSAAPRLRRAARHWYAAEARGSCARRNVTRDKDAGVR
jgi:hypothetical protein